MPINRSSNVTNQAVVKRLRLNSHLFDVITERIEPPSIPGFRLPLK